MRRDAVAIVGAFAGELFLVALAGFALDRQWAWNEAGGLARALAVRESSGTEHMLRARYGVDHSYDRLASDLAGERSDVEALSRVAGLAPSDELLQSGIRASRVYLGERDEAVEAFKSADAVVRNSRAHVPQLLDTVRAAAGPDLAAAALQLESALYRYEVQPSEAAADGVLQAADALDVVAGATEGSDGMLLSRQARTYVDRSMRVDDALDAVLTLRSEASPYQALADLVSGREGRAAWVTHLAVAALAAWSACLIGAVLLTARRLTWSQRELQDAVTGLEARNAEIAVQKDIVASLNRDLEARVEIRTRELAEANRQLAASSRAKTEFLANMSHEIRTPLSAVQGFAELMLDPDLSASDRLDHVLTIRRNGEHLLGVINDILDLSKIDAGRMTLEAVPASPAKLLVDVASLMRVRAVEKGIDFKVRFLTPIPERIVGDPTRMRQILLNLVGNAIKFTDKGGVAVEVGLEGEGSRVLKMSVRDTGIGLSAEQIGRLFQPFTQADTSTTRRFGGTGLGLSICQRLATAMGGSITVDSTPGAGSCFSFAVPVGTLEGVRLLDDLSESITPSNPSREQAATRFRQGLRVLLAEDGRDNQLLISTHLRKSGAEVVVVEDGALAVDAAYEAWTRGRAFDVILMDMQMPVLDGYGAASKLRARGYAQPIVALTAHAMAGDRERCLNAGCDDYLTKPIDRGALLAAVDRWSSNSSSKADAQAPTRARTSDAGSAPGEPLVSTFADDADMADLVVEFVDSLPDHVYAMQRALSANDRDELKKLAHQMKGAGGGYGFMPLTHAAGDVERAVSDGGSPRDLATKLKVLADLCQRAAKPKIGRVA